MSKKYQCYFFTGLLSGMILPGVLSWLGIPRYDQILEVLLGEPNTLNRILAILIMAALILMIYKLPNSIKKTTH